MGAKKRLRAELAAMTYNHQEMLVVARRQQVRLSRASALCREARRVQAQHDPLGSVLVSEETLHAILHGEIA